MAEPRRAVSLPRFSQGGHYPRRLSSLLSDDMKNPVDEKNRYSQVSLTTSLSPVYDPLLEGMITSRTYKSISHTGSE